MATCDLDTLIQQACDSGFAKQNRINSLASTLQLISNYSGNTLSVSDLEIQACLSGFKDQSRQQATGIALQLQLYCNIINGITPPTPPVINCVTVSGAGTIIFNGDYSLGGNPAQPSYYYNASSDTYIIFSNDFNAWALTDNGFNVSYFSANLISTTWTATAGHQPSPTTVTCGGLSVPVMNNPGDQSFTIGNSVSVQLTASNSPTSFSCSNLPDGLSLNTSTGLITGTAINQNHKTSSATATNAGGTSASVSFNWVILPIPIVLSANVVSANQIDLSWTAEPGIGITYAVYINTSSPPTNQVISGLTGLTYSATVYSGGIITAGLVFYIMIVSTNNVGETATSNIVAASTLTAPVLTNPGTQNFNIGDSVNLQLVATQSPTSYTCSPLPAGLSLNSSTGLITGTVTTEQVVGSTATCTNGIISAPVNFTWNVVKLHNIIVTGAGSAGANKTYIFDATQTAAFGNPTYVQQPWDPSFGSNQFVVTNTFAGVTNYSIVQVAAGDGTVIDQFYFTTTVPSVPPPYGTSYPTTQADGALPTPTVTFNLP
jgi:hypothetical protein